MNKPDRLKKMSMDYLWPEYPELIYEHLTPVSKEKVDQLVDLLERAKVEGRLDTIQRTYFEITQMQPKRGRLQGIKTKILHYLSFKENQLKAQLKSQEGK